MVKVITYGTYDMLHYGHIRLLERAKALGDYLIVGVTADDFDKVRGKINVQQSLMERIEGVKATGLADEIIVEEYEGQKIDDIRRYDVDIFTVGSDWTGKFDYLNEYCKVIYLERTWGVSSTDLRTEKRNLRIGIVSEFSNVKKYIRESSFVNGLEISTVCTNNAELKQICAENRINVVASYEQLLENVDAVYIASHPKQHYMYIEEALKKRKHVLCETPIALTVRECRKLLVKAKEQNLVLMEAIKTAYSTAYNRLLLLIKSGRIGQVLSVEATCTSLNPRLNQKGADLSTEQSSICAWGPTAMLPVFQILGTDFKKVGFVSAYSDYEKDFDLFSKIDFLYDTAAATVKVGKGVKSEGELIISGTEGYVYVPAPWWKTDYFEIRYEDQSENKRYFYQLDGEGIRYELVTFVKAINASHVVPYIEKNVSEAISDTIEKFYRKENLACITFTENQKMQK